MGMFGLWLLLAVVVPSPLWLYGAKHEDNALALIGAAIWSLIVTGTFLG